MLDPRVLQYLTWTPMIIDINCKHASEQISSTFGEIWEWESLECSKITSEEQAHLSRSPNAPRIFPSQQNIQYYAYTPNIHFWSIATIIQHLGGHSHRSSISTYEWLSFFIVCNKSKIDESNFGTSLVCCIHHIVEFHVSMNNSILVTCFKGSYNLLDGLCS